MSHPLSQSTPSSKAWFALISQIRNAVIFSSTCEIDEFDLAAICVKETYGNAWFSCVPCDKTLSANLLKVTEVTGVSTSELLRALTVSGRPRACALPKFRFEPTWWNLMKEKGTFQELSQVQRAVVACSLGIAQKSGLYLLLAIQPEMRWTYLTQFKSDEGMQLRVAYKDLCALLCRSDADKPLAFSRYNAGASADEHTPYGDQVHGLASSLRNVYKGGAQGKTPPAL